MIGRGRGGGGVLAGYDGAEGDEDAETLVVDEDDDDGSIVVRGANGEVEVEEPPFLPVDDPDEIVLDMRQENESKSGLCFWGFHLISHSFSSSLLLLNW